MENMNAELLIINRITHNFALCLLSSDVYAVADPGFDLTGGVDFVNGGGG